MHEIFQLDCIDKINTFLCIIHTQSWSNCICVCMPSSTQRIKQDLPLHFMNVSSHIAIYSVPPRVLAVNCVRYVHFMDLLRLCRQGSSLCTRQYSLALIHLMFNELVMRKYTHLKKDLKPHGSLVEFFFLSCERVISSR